jgi:mannose-6-phosphate isomerase-like protein (cupin superfamily)
MDSSASRVGRLVVTGRGADGSDGICSDTIVAPIPLAGDGVLAHLVYGNDGPVSLPNDGQIPDHEGFSPPVGGCRLSFLTIAEGENDRYHSFIAEGMGEFADPSRPGFHATPTLDLIVVVSGTVRMETDRGEVQLRAGDTVVQNGTLHRWSNAGSGPAVLASVVMGARSA